MKTSVQVIGGLMVLLSACACLASAPGMPLKIGDIPPGFVGMKHVDEPLNLGDLRGKVVVVDFFASWCGPCRQSLPVLNNAQKALGDQIAVVVVDYGEDDDHFRAIRRALHEFVVTFTSDPDRQIGDSYDVKALPHTVIIDRNGHIAAIHEGFNDHTIDVLVDDLNRVLQVPAGTASATSPSAMR